MAQPASASAMHALIAREGIRKSRAVRPLAQTIESSGHREDQLALVVEALALKVPQAGAHAREHVPQRLELLHRARVEEPHREHGLRRAEALHHVLGVTT